MNGRSWLEITNSNVNVLANQVGGEGLRERGYPFDRDPEARVQDPVREQEKPELEYLEGMGHSSSLPENPNTAYFPKSVVMATQGTDLPMACSLAGILLIPLLCGLTSA